MPAHSPHEEPVRRTLVEAAGPLSAAEVRAALADTGIGAATVYRLLNRGVEEGVFQAVEMPGAATRFEPADRPHHHHFACAGCDRVFDLVGCPGGIADLLPDGFTMDSHEILLRGRCGECRGAA